MFDKEKLKDKKSNDAATSGSVGPKAGSSVLLCANDQEQNNPPLVQQTDVLSITCEHGRLQDPSKIPYYGLVPTKGTFEKSDTVNVSWIGPHKPASLSIEGLNNTKAEIKGFAIKFPYIPDPNTPSFSQNDATQKKAGAGKTKRLASAAGLAIWKQWDAIYTYKHRPSMYIIKELGLPVNVYDTVQWTFKINQLPKLNGFKVGAKLKNTDKEKKFEVEYKDKKIQAQYEHSLDKESGDISNTFKIESDKSSYEAVSKTSSGTKSLVTTQEDKSKLSSAVDKIKDLVSLEKDGDPIQVNALSVISFIVFTGKYIYDTIKLINDEVPQIGWYADFNLELWQGNFEVKWGWKEHTDFHVYYSIEPQINITIISASLELGFGFSGPAFKAQIFGLLNGSIKCNVVLIDSNPEKTKFSGKVEGEIIGGLGARFEVGYCVKIEATITTGITTKGELEINTADGIKLEAELVWTGIVAKVTFTRKKWLLFGQDIPKEEKKEFMPKKDLGSITLPSIKDYEPEITSDNDIYEITKNMLYKGWNIRVANEDYYIDNELIATETSNKIIQRQDIKKDRKSIEGLTHGIRQALEEMETGRIWNYHVEERKFYEFLNGPKFNALLDNIKDPLSQFNP
jgi:hypothetical protein